MKDNYTNPTLDIIEFTKEDVLEVSTGAFNESQPGDKEVPIDDFTKK